MTLNAVLEGVGVGGWGASLELKVMVVSYSVAAEKETTARRKVLTHAGHPPEQIKIIIHFFLMQREGGAQFNCSTDLFLVRCHSH